MSREETIKLLGILYAAYPFIKDKIKDPNTTVSTWEMTLGEFTADAVYKAARLHIATNKYFPSPADIREKIVRAQLVYSSSEIGQDSLQADNTKLLEDPENKTEVWDDERLENLCKFVGFGYPNEIECD